MQNQTFIGDLVTLTALRPFGTTALRWNSTHIEEVPWHHGKPTSTLPYLSMESQTVQTRYYIVEKRLYITSGRCFLQQSNSIPVAVEIFCDIVHLLLPGCAFQILKVWPCDRMTRIIVTGVVWLFVNAVWKTAKRRKGNHKRIILTLSIIVEIFECLNVDFAWEADWLVTGEFLILLSLNSRMVLVYCIGAPFEITEFQTLARP